MKFKFLCFLACITSGSCRWFLLLLAAPACRSFRHRQVPKLQEAAEGWSFQAAEVSCAGASGIPICRAFSGALWFSWDVGRPSPYLLGHAKEMTRIRSRTAFLARTLGLVGREDKAAFFFFPQAPGMRSQEMTPHSKSRNTKHRV